MGQRIIPSQQEFDGPWLIDNNKLEELNETLLLIEKKLNDACNILLGIHTTTRFNEYKKWDKNVTAEDIKQEIQNSYPFHNSNKYVSLTNKQGTKITDKDLLSLLKDPQIKEFNPIDLIIHIQNGPYKFILEISTNPYRNLKTIIDVSNDSIFNDINYEINKWIDKHRPNYLSQKWSSFFPFASLLIFILLFFSTSLLLKGQANLYKTELARESSIILKDGLDNNNTTKAIEIILKYESDYIPENFSTDTTINKEIEYFLILIILTLALLSISPKTVIGLGKNKWKVIFYRRWIYFVSIFIPVSILLPIIIAKLFL
ncbi:MAG: hypothetical protein AB7E39_08210 [Endomicrobiaceae bacterium]